MNHPQMFRDLERPRVLLVALSGIGNLLMASPLFRAFQDANSTAELDLLVASRGTKSVLEANPRVRRVFAGSPKPNIRALRKLTGILRRERYAVGIVTYPGQLILSAALLRLASIPRRIGHRYSWTFLRDSGLFFSDPVPEAPLPAFTIPASAAAHDVVQNLGLLQPLGITVDPGTARYEFPLTTDDRAHADAWLTQHDPGGHTLIGLHPGSYGDLAYKRWPAERFAELGDRLAERYHATVLVIGGPEERALKAEVGARMHARSVMVDAPLRVTAALIARCLCFVSNDSGLMHVAVAQSVPTFGLFGPTDERRTAPWGPNGHVIRAAGTQPTYDVQRLRNIRDRNAPDSSLLALSVEAVARAVSVTVQVPVPPREPH
ncbi:MAG: glycosyl transferase family protein [Parcubacteria group bacterium Gr01-1014_38]|nr:MAG: glycosyl transferase family protein [Parcubacteria group bacterium Gr01-1014_38]